MNKSNSDIYRRLIVGSPVYFPSGLEAPISAGHHRNFSTSFVFVVGEFYFRALAAAQYGLASPRSLISLLPQTGL